MSCGTCTNGACCFEVGAPEVVKMSPRIVPECVEMDGVTVAVIELVALMLKSTIPAEEVHTSKVRSAQAASK